MNTEMREKISDLLMSTGREGMDNLVQWMDDNGFFAAPCSGGNHLAKEGGLAEHSLNVLNVLQDVSFLLCKGPEILSKEQQDSIIICALLHDLGKCGDHGKAGYVPNFVRSKKKNENGEYDLVQSTAKPYGVNKELMYIPHEVRSVAIAERFITLTEEEEFAILYHNGLYGDFRYAIQGKETPLYLLLHFADMWASHVLEVEKGAGE